MTLPKIDDDQRAAAFNRGNHFRRIGEFDRALTVLQSYDMGKIGFIQELTRGIAKVLDIEPENAKAYLGKLMAELRVKQRNDLQNCKDPFDGNGDYKKILRSGDGKLKSELTGYVEQIKERNEHARLEGYRFCLCRHILHRWLEG